MGQLRLALRTFRRADASLPEAHGRQTLPVCGLLQGLFPIRPPGPAHEETPKLAATYTHTHTRIHTHTPTSHERYPDFYPELSVSVTNVRSCQISAAFSQTKQLPLVLLSCAKKKGTVASKNRVAPHQEQVREDFLT